MKTTISNINTGHDKIAESSWEKKITALGKLFEDRQAEHDEQDAFVEANYRDLKTIGFFKALIPNELGGGGLSHSKVADLLRITAHHCPSTGLASCMHQHLVAANVWKYSKNGDSAGMLKWIAEAQPILVSTGARDWLESNGEVVRTEGGYLVSGMKHFASQSAVGDILVTSAPYEDPQEGWCVLHFPIPFSAKGLTVLNNWKAMGMRGTGSHSVKLDNVFVPDSAIVLKRRREGFHPLYNVIVTVAMPFIMGVYLGATQRAVEIADHFARSRKDRKTHLLSAVGEMHNHLTTAEVCWRDMVHIANDLDFEPADQNSQDILTRKTIVSKACVRTVEVAMEIAGGQGFFRGSGLEKLFRDIQASKYHPLPERDQVVFSGSYVLDGKN
jgi:alkylation response protein AidB-like acyl-CoA dehydrogenase